MSDEREELLRRRQELIDQINACRTYAEAKPLIKRLGNIEAFLAYGPRLVSKPE